jgi:hypothetical protein
LDWTPAFCRLTFKDVTENLVVQGRQVGPRDLELLRQWMGQNPGWSRRRISQELAAHWDWRNGAGQLKDMAARTLLLKLDQRGLIALPPRRQVPTNRMRCRSEGMDNRQWDQRPIECGLAQLGALSVGEVSGQAAQRAWVETFVERERFAGTAYRAANWLAAGATTGRTRQDRHTCIQAPVKDIYLYPLRRSFREALQA